MREPFVQDSDFTLWQGDALDVLREERIEYDAIVTSPPYLDARPEYGTPDAQWWDEFFALAHGPALLNVGRLWRDGEESDWWMRLLGYAKANGWCHLDTLIWVKPNANPISGQILVNSHEYVLIIGNGESSLNVDELRTPYAASSVARLDRGWTNHIGVKNVHSDRQRSADELHPLGARPRSYVIAPVGRDKDNPHPAPMAEELAGHLVRLACAAGRVILDPFGGSGTTALAARKHGRKSVLIEMNYSYSRLAAKRLQQLSLLSEPAA